MQKAVVFVAPPAEKCMVRVHRLRVRHRLCVDSVDVWRALFRNDSCLLLRQLGVLLTQLFGATHVGKEARDGVEDLLAGVRSRAQTFSGFVGFL